MQFRIPRIIRGVQVFVLFCATSKSAAAKFLDTSLYEVDNYCSCYPPKDKCCIENPYTKYALFDSGELCYAKPEWRNKLMPLSDIENFIVEHRKTFRSYYETVRHFESLTTPPQTGV